MLEYCISFQTSSNSWFSPSHSYEGILLCVFEKKVFIFNNWIFTINIYKRTNLVGFCFINIFLNTCECVSYTEPLLKDTLDNLLPFNYTFGVK